MAYKPDGFPSVAPYVFVEKVAPFLEFLQAMFGATVIDALSADDGEIHHAAVWIDDTVVMMGPMPQPPQSHLHVYVPDVDIVFSNGLQAGGSVFEPPTDQPYGDRRGAVVDPSGAVTFWVATRG
ncbi:MAG: VOC family protein [Pseudomonadota bacterium]